MIRCFLAALALSFLHPLSCTIPTSLPQEYLEGEDLRDFWIKIMVDSVWETQRGDDRENKIALYALKPSIYPLDLKALKHYCLLNLEYLTCASDEDLPDAFLESSILCIHTISSEDLLQALMVFLERKEEENRMDPVFCIAGRDENPQVILASQTEGSVHSFYELPLSEEDRRNIDFIISTLSQENLVQLTLSKKALEKKGKKIERVHPLRFIGYVLSHSELKQALRHIRKSSFKWDHVIHGFSRRMKEEKSHHNLHAHIPGFSHQVGCSEELVHRYIQHKDWEGLVKALL